MKQYSDRHLDSASRGQEISDSDASELIIQFQRAHSKLKRRIDMGTLILSSDAINALSELEKKLKASSANESWIEHLDTEVTLLTNVSKPSRVMLKKISTFPERAA